MRCTPRGQWDFIDQIVFWTNIVAGALQPALFLHFAISFPEERLKDVGRRWLLPVLYGPGTALLALWVIAITRWQATGVLLHRLDQINLAYVTCLLRAGCRSLRAQLQPRGIRPCCANS